MENVAHYVYLDFKELYKILHKSEVILLLIQSLTAIHTCTIFSRDNIFQLTPPDPPLSQKIYDPPLMVKFYDPPLQNLACSPMGSVLHLLNDVIVTTLEYRVSKILFRVTLFSILFSDPYVLGVQHGIPGHRTPSVSLVTCWAQRTRRRHTRIRRRRSCRQASAFARTLARSQAGLYRCT